MTIDILPRSSIHRSSSPLAVLSSLVVRRLLPLWCLGWAILFAWTSICAIGNFSWRQPFSDEYVLYRTFLNTPFPANILQAGNGHRPIFPNLLIDAENRWFAGDHSLQFAFGLFCAIATALVIALCAWRERQLNLASRAACVMLGVLGVLCLANGRMLFHSYESVHVYLLTFSVALAGVATFEAWRRQQRRWLVLACVACTIAMFCFGSGVASFPAVIVLAFALRLPPRWYAIPFVTLGVCLFLYLFALPGDQSVRGVLAFRPIDSMTVAVDWLSSPWVRLWLGHAPPPLDASFTAAMPYAHFGKEVVASATWLQSVSGLSWQTLSRIAGFAGIALFLALLARFAFVREAKPSRLQTLALMLCLFALATAVVIGLTRLDYFHKYPDQVWADRYVVWPNLFWAGLSILLVLEAQRLRRRAITAAGTAILIALPLVAVPTQQTYVGWASIVYRNSQQSAAIVRSGLFKADLFPNGDDAHAEDVQRSLSLLKQKHLAMFSDPMFESIGSIWSKPIERSTSPSAEAHVSDLFDDPFTGIHAAHFEGKMSSNVADIRMDDHLAVLDDDSRIVGFAELSHFSHEQALMFTVPRKTGFDGYIRGYSENRHYRLVALSSEAAATSRLLADIRPPSPVPNQQ